MKFVIVVLLFVGVIAALVYVSQLIFGLKKNPTGTLSDLKSEVVETVSKVKETKEKVNNINQEVDEINETLKNS
jgi:peptidoglycan hydrolase CwlO-like protein